MKEEGEKRKAEQQPSVLFLAYGSRVWEIGGNGVELARNIYAAERARKCRVSFNERRAATKRTQETGKGKGRGEGEVAFSFNLRKHKGSLEVKFNCFVFERLHAIRDVEEIKIYWEFVAQSK